MTPSTDPVDFTHHDPVDFIQPIALLSGLD